MEPIDSFKSCTSRGDEVEAAELLDEYWFFENLFKRKTSMFRSSSDPYPTSKSIHEAFDQNESSEQSLGLSKSIQETFDQIQSSDKSFSSLNVRKEDALVRHNLHRTPSLPPSVGTEETSREKDFVRKTSQLTRQASLCSPNVLPPPRSPKITALSPGMPKHQARRESKIDTTTKYRKKSNLMTKEVISRSLSQKLSSKSRTELESEEVQGFKDLGFVFDKEVLNPTVINIIPGLQSKKPVDREDDKGRRPYLSEAWLVQRSTPPIPDWIDGRDVKAQLRFWARMVASNVHQEC